MYKFSTPAIKFFVLFVIIYYTHSGFTWRNVKVNVQLNPVFYMSKEIKSRRIWGNDSCLEM